MRPPRIKQKSRTGNKSRAALDVHLPHKYYCQLRVRYLLGDCYVRRYKLMLKILRHVNIAELMFCDHNADFAKLYQV
jgi:hypothetical protein